MKPNFENGNLKCPYTLKDCHVNDTVPYSSCPGCKHNTTNPFGPNDIVVINGPGDEPGVQKIAFVANGQSIPLAFVPRHWLEQQNRRIATFVETTFEHVFNDFSEFSLRTFVKSTPQSSLIHLRREADEVEKELNSGTINRPDLLEEYADMLLCIITSAARAGITSPELVSAMDKKAQKNKRRKWAYNGDGTYSHVKDGN